jgi:hypothetical protein
MGRRTRRLMRVVVAVCLGTAPGAVRAQVGQGVVGTGASGSTPGFFGNPFANPYLNPYLNPYMSQSTMRPGDAALSFIAAQQALGGIGSGQLSGVRPPRGTATAPVPARGQTTNSSMVPGGNAARYFNRSYQPATGAGSYYNRQGRYFPKNGR